MGVVEQVEILLGCFGNGGFERSCLSAGMEALSLMMEADVEAACGRRHALDQPLREDNLAAIARLSPTAFHRQFKN